MGINWNDVYKNDRYRELKRKKDNLYDMIIGELNRISVSDTIEEKDYLLRVLKENINNYYKLSCECTNILNSFAKEV